MVPLACHQLSGNYGKPPHHPQLSDISGRLPTRELATIRTRLHRSETADRGPSSAVNHQPPILKPQPFSVGVFSCPIAQVPAYSCGFLRTPADFAGQPVSQFRATFHSLLAIPRSDLTPRTHTEHARTIRVELPAKLQSRRTSMTIPMKRGTDSDMTGLR